MFKSIDKDFFLNNNIKHDLKYKICHDF